MAHDVFVSHSVKDKVVADAVVARLEAKSVTCWVAPRDVVPGADWGESIINAIESSRIMILIFSKNANQSSQIKREVERAVNKEVYIIPFRIDDIPPTRSLEYFISTSQWMDAFSPPLERHLDNLAKTVKTVLANLSLRKPVEVEAPLGSPLPNPVDNESALTPAGRIGPVVNVSTAHPSIEAYRTGKRWHDLRWHWRMAIIAAVPAVLILAAVGWYWGQKREVRLEKSNRLIRTEDPGAVAKPANDETGKKIASSETTTEPSSLLSSSGSASPLIGHWRKTTIESESPEDEHLVLHADGTAEDWNVSAYKRTEPLRGRWSVEGKTLTLSFGSNENSRPFTLYEGQLVFPNIPNRRQFWEKIE